MTRRCLSADWPILRLLLGATAAALLAAGCEGPGEPRPIDGVYTASLVSPYGAEGAALVELTGPGIGSVSALEGEVFSERVGDVARALVVLTEPGDIRFQVEVRGATVLPEARVLEVAGPANEARAVGGYRLELSP